MSVCKPGQKIIKQQITPFPRVFSTKRESHFIFLHLYLSNKVKKHIQASPSVHTYQKCLLLAIAVTMPAAKKGEQMV
jgi:hypothetical protein